MRGKCIRLYKYNAEQVKEIVEVLDNFYRYLMYEKEGVVTDLLELEMLY